MNDHEQRLITLETQLAFQDDLLEVLNQQLARQSQEIDLLQEQVRRLNQRLTSLKESQGDDKQPSLLDERPPHY